MDERRCNCVCCPRRKRVNQCAGGMCLGLCESPEWSITYPVELLARRVRSRKRERKRGRESERNVKWNPNSSFKVHRNIYALIAKHLSLFPSTLSLSLSLSLILFSIFVIPHWALISSLTYSFLFSPGQNKVIKNDLSTKEQKISGWEWKRVRQRGEGGMRIEKKEEREGV